jgi:Mn2+/Fe2+ NRAMP family transporter
MFLCISSCLYLLFLPLLLFTLRLCTGRRSFMTFTTFHHTILTPLLVVVVVVVCQTLVGIAIGGLGASVAGFIFFQHLRGTIDLEKVWHTYHKVSSST